MSDPIKNLINTYNELNAAVVDELPEEPSPLEFMRYVAKNRPFVVRGAAKEWKAYRDWNADYLRRVMGEQEVNIAVTPGGNADAVVTHPTTTHTLLYAAPHETLLPFTTFLDLVQKPLLQNKPPSKSNPVHYAQTQNSNLHTEYSALLPDLPPSEIPFARIALATSGGADAINFWLGNNLSITSLHRDHYENIYVPIRGAKHFVLLPPLAQPYVAERRIRRARYDAHLTLQELPEEEEVPVPTWDPDADDGSGETEVVRPLRVTVGEGDMLYLPAMWYHKVTQSVGEEGFACAVNYWYDMDFSGGFWAMNQFLGEVVEAQRRQDGEQ